MRCGRCSPTNCACQKLVDDDVDAWEVKEVQVRQTIWMSYQTETPCRNFRLHIDGDDAWWRWHDEPFGR
jgi:hypothetical protein